MKKLLILTPLVLTGCWLPQWLTDNAEPLTKASETIEGFGPYGALVGLGITSVVAAAKWYKHKIAAKEVIKAIQGSKRGLSKEAKLILKNSLTTRMPIKVQKYVAKIKKTLK